MTEKQFVSLFKLKKEKQAYVQIAQLANSQTKQKKTEKLCITAILCIKQHYKYQKIMLIIMNTDKNDYLTLKSSASYGMISTVAE